MIGTGVAVLCVGRQQNSAGEVKRLKVPNQTCCRNRRLILRRISGIGNQNAHRRPIANPQVRIGDLAFHHMNLGLVVAIQQVDPVDLQFFLHVVDKGFPYPGHVKGSDKVFDRVVPIAVLKRDVRQMIGAIAKHSRENMF